MQEYTFQCGGKELARVLFYYGLIPDTTSAKQSIVCPFHNDINPSMIVDIEIGMFYCFGCAMSGNAMDFVRYMNPELNDLKAVILYNKIIASDTVQKVTIPTRFKPKKQSKLAYAEAYDYYHGLNVTNWKSDALVDEAAAARAYMNSRGFTNKALIHSGAKANYKSNYPIVFPIMDNGKFKGWVCRTNNDSTKDKGFKYLYNEGFIKKQTVVGNYGKTDHVIIVEGYMDRLKMVQNLNELGIRESVVAIFGWKISPEQLQKLEEAGIKYVISALDNDDCGKKGTTYLETKISTVRFAYIKGIKDPGDMDTKAFEKMYNKTMERIKRRDE